MKRYLVKETSVATKENPNFAGETSISFHGKGDELDIGNTYSRYFAIEYGYKRRCDAERNWTYNNPENSRFWKSAVEIVDVYLE